MPSTAKQRSVAQLETSASVSIAHAKANFSSLISAVEKKHDAVTILRRGIPVAQIVPFPEATIPPLRGSMVGTVRILGDIVSPSGIEWTVSDE